MTATILDHPNRPTWANVRELYNRATQMEKQTVGAYADLGDMLIGLKHDPKTPHGEFLARCAEAFGQRPDASGLSRKQQKVVADRASNYMRLASFREVWEAHNPTSIRGALGLLPKPQKSCRMGWSAYLRDRFGAKTDRQFSGIRNNRKAEVEELLRSFGIAADGPDKGCLTSPEQAKAFGDAWLRTFTPEVEPPTLDPKSRQAVQRAIDAEASKLAKEFHGVVEEAVREKVKVNTAHLIEEMTADIAEAKRKERNYDKALAGLKGFMTRDEFRLILNCLHPDRAPEDRRERFAEAFAVMNRLGGVFE
jgi:hypothetical protein